MSVCATCLKPGLPADGHDCPGLGIRVDTAPARAQMALNVLTEHGWGAALVGADQVNIADQVLYQVVGYDAESASLVLELVEDWRPNSAPDEDDAEPTGPAQPGIPRCTATWNTEHQGTARCWRAATHNQREGYEAHMGEAEHGYRLQWIGTEPGAVPHHADLPLNYACAACRYRAAGNLGAHDELPCVCRDEMCEGCPPPPADATVCTPIPAETLTRMSEVPAELLTEQQRARAENAEDQLRRTRIELEHWQTVIIPELRAERDKARTTLREVLAAFATVTSQASGATMGYQAPPIHPDDMARWRAALVDPKPLTGADGRAICICTYGTPCGCGTSVHYTPREQPMPDSKPACTATIEGPHVLGGGPVQCTREAGHPENHVGPRMGDAGKALWTDHHAGATPHRAPTPGEG